MNTTKITQWLLAVLFSFSYLITTQVANAQTVPIIEIDTITGAPNGPIPFDKPFVLKIKVNSQPEFVDYIITRKRIPWYEEVKKRLRFTKNFYFPYIPEEHYWTENEGKSTYLYVRFDYLPDAKRPLRKDSNNLIGTSKHLTLLLGESSVGLQAYRLMHQNKIDEVKNLIQKTEGEHLQKFGLIYNVPIYEEVEAEYKSFMRKHFLEIDSIDKVLSADIPSTQEEFIKLNGSKTLSGLVKLSFNCDTCKSLTRQCFNACDLSKVAQSLYMLNNETAKNLAEGIVGLADIRKKVKGKNIGNKLVNLKSTQKLLIELQTAISLGIIKGSISNGDGHYSVISNLVNMIDKAINDYQNAIAAENRIKNRLRQIGHFSLPNTSKVGQLETTIYDFKARNKLQIVPDFGYVAYGFESGIQKGYTSFAPYLGFQLSLRPIDKDIPFRLYPNKTLWHYLSVSVGYTITKLEKEGRREDFFGKGSLLLGTGIRITNGFKVNVGSIWFYKTDPNPIISDRSLAIGAYAGLSLDLDLKEFINGFGDLIPTRKQ